MVTNLVICRAWPSTDSEISWHPENCRPATGSNGYDIVDKIRQLAHEFGEVKLFKAYLELAAPFNSSKILNLRSELQSSGVSLIDCPHRGKKNVADKMILGK